MIGKIGQVINYTVSIILWMIERMITRFGFVVSGVLIWITMYDITKSLLSSQLEGTAYYVLEKNRIGFLDVLGILLGLAICLLVIAPITQMLGEILEHLMDFLRLRQEKRLYIDNKKIGKVFFIVWSLTALTVAFFNLITLFDYSIMYVAISLTLDLVVGWFLFIYSVDLEPEELLFFLAFIPCGSGGSTSSYVIFQID